MDIQELNSLLKSEDVYKVALLDGREVDVPLGTPTHQESKEVIKMFIDGAILADKLDEESKKSGQRESTSNFEMLMTVLNEYLGAAEHACKACIKGCDDIGKLIMLTGSTQSPLLIECSKRCGVGKVYIMAFKDLIDYYNRLENYEGKGKVEEEEVVDDNHDELQVHEREGEDNTVEVQLHERQHQAA